MNDLISRKAMLEALGHFNDYKNGNKHFLNGIETAKEIAENLPAVDAAPRVMTREEIIHHEGYVWEEFLDVKAMSVMLIQSEMTYDSMQEDCPITEYYWGGYGKTWRCWTSQPTDEQRASTPWEDTYDRENHP